MKMTSDILYIVILLISYQIYFIYSEDIYNSYNAKTIDYLSKFGYYQSASDRIGDLQVHTSIEYSLKRLQKFAGLPQTGLVDAQTIALMQRPRCGLSDHVTKLFVKRKKRYVVQGTRWKKLKLTWKLQNTNKDGLSRQQIESVLEKAFSKWKDVSNLQFEKLHFSSNKKPDIEIKFAVRNHGDRFPFDEAGGTLAHAFYPHNNQGLSGDVHFDDDEAFTINSKTGKNLLWVATHEIGHSLGLEHSSVKEAVMYPWYRKNLGDDFHLFDDDIAGIQSLYGTKKEQPITLQPIATTIQTPRYACVHNIGAILLDDRTKETYVIDGNKVVVLDRNLERSGFTRPLNELFPGVESADSAYIRPNKKVLFFKDERFYEFYSMEKRQLVDKGLINQKYFGLPQDINKIDAAFNWKGNGRTYLFTGKEYYRYDEWRRAIDHGYPKNIEKYWKGVPGNIDAVFDWRNGETYFFKDSKYYRFNYRKVQIEYGYPRDVSGVWFACQKSIVGNIENGDTSLTIHVMTIIISVFTSLYLIR